RATPAPRRASASAVSKPIPELAPVTTQVFPRMGSYVRYLLVSHFPQVQGSCDARFGTMYSRFGRRGSHFSLVPSSFQRNLNSRTLPTRNGTVTVHVPPASRVSCMALDKCHSPRMLFFPET